MKRGGGGNGGGSGPIVCGLDGGMLTPVCEFLSVKIGELLDRIPSLGEKFSSFSFTTSLFSSFSVVFSFLTFKAGEADSSCSLRKSISEDLASVFCLLRSLD